MGSVQFSVTTGGKNYCVKDADCYLSTATAADKAKTCCAKYTITKLDSTKPNHATDLAILKTYGFTDDKIDEWDTIQRCNSDYPVTFGATYMKDDTTIAGGAWSNAGITFKAYCNGGETLAFAGKMVAATGMAYMAMY